MSVRSPLQSRGSRLSSPVLAATVPGFHLRFHRCLDCSPGTTSDPPLLLCWPPVIKHTVPVAAARCTRKLAGGPQYTGTAAAYSRYASHLLHTFRQRLCAAGRSTQAAALLRARCGWCVACWVGGKGGGGGGRAGAGWCRHCAGAYAPWLHRDTPWYSHSRTSC